MKVVQLIRLEKTSQGIIGALIIDSIVHSWTLEKDDTFIKPGVYHCQRFHGERWKDTFEIKVPGHTAVLFHSGNTEADTQGCVLLGATIGKLKGDRAVLNSGVSFSNFMEKMGKDVDFKLFIETKFRRRYEFVLENHVIWDFGVSSADYRPGYSYPAAEMDTYLKRYFGYSGVLFRQG